MARKNKGFSIFKVGDERFAKVLGLFLMFLAFYLFVSFVSYLFTWEEDQDRVLQFSWGLLLEDFEMSNWLGRLGAILSNIFFYWGFGFSSFLFVLFLYKVGLGLTKRPGFSQFQLLNLRNTAIYMVLLSTLAAFIFQQSRFPWGGAFGDAVAMWVQNLLGTFGTIAFILFSTFGLFVWRTNIQLENLTLDGFASQAKAYFNDVIKSGKPAAVNRDSRSQEEERRTFDSRGQLEIGAFDDGDMVAPVVLSGSGLFDDDEPQTQKAVSDLPATELSQKSELFDNSSVAVGGSASLEVVKTAVEPDWIQNGREENVNLVSTNQVPNAGFTSENVFGRKLDDIGMDPYDPMADLQHYEHPNLQLLNSFDDQKYEVDRAELEENKDQIVQTLLNFKIEIEKIRATIGPTVTLYEIVPSRGIRISKIKSLEDDIALSLSALGIRIIAPIPGKGTIGIEVPNKNRQIVGMKEVLMSEKFRKASMDIPLALGKTISNEVYVADLAKMPHLLIAGATGQGKSVGINVILMSVFYKKHPAQIKVIMIDPKKVELFPYSRLENHFLGFLQDQPEPIATDTTRVVHILNSLIVEMESRYNLLKAAEVRNINEYNEKFVARRLNPVKGHKYLPFIVLIIDEFADLIMTAGKEIELPIGRLAQLARAVGIHLIIATQRPSVNIITGVIKANFPARIAYKVASKIDSRTILDTGGAEQLTGRGDMLLSIGGDIIRLQSAFVDTPEVEEVIKFIANQQGYPEPYFLPEVQYENDTEATKSFSLSEMDDMLEDAGRLIVQSQHGSTSMIQRRMKLGYNRAGRIMDQLEALGVVGPAEGSKPREVLFFDEGELIRFFEELRKKKSGI